MRKQRGFTLLETLLTLAIIGGGTAYTLKFAELADGAATDYVASLPQHSEYQKAEAELKAQLEKHGCPL